MFIKLVLPQLGLHNTLRRWPVVRYNVSIAFLVNAILSRRALLDRPLRKLQLPAPSSFARSTQEAASTYGGAVVGLWLSRSERCIWNTACAVSLYPCPRRDLARSTFRVVSGCVKLVWVPRPFVLSAWSCMLLSCAADQNFMVVTTEQVATAFPFLAFSRVFHRYSVKSCP